MSENKEISLKEVARRCPGAFKKQEKRNVLLALITFPFRAIGAMMGITKDTLGTYTKNSKLEHRNIHSHSSHHSAHHTPQAAFREQHHFDPEKWVIKEMQAEAYHDLVDGKGDHDCDHEH